MDEVMKLLPTLMTPANMAEARAEVMRSFEHDQAIQCRNLRRLPPPPPGPATETETSTFLKDIDSEPVQLHSALRRMMEESLHPRYPPPTALPCANVQAEKYAVCKNAGKMACSACKLVSYCSKECQKAHWKQHKRDCNNSMRSPDWKPIWLRERRTPSFITDDFEEEAFRNLPKDEFSLGMSLWGNTPAMDIINLACNENDSKKDFSLAFIASGDLRHVLRTFNGLPLDYSGRLNFLVNDHNPFIFSRNIALLLILGNVANETIAADIALHFWYSAFIPVGYRFQLSVILMAFLQKLTDGVLPIPLGPRSTISAFVSKEVASHLSHFVSSQLSTAEIQNEYDRVRTAPSRCDYRDRMYASLKPSHRVAFNEFRRFGIVLPFGAMNAHFNCPNLSLFSLDGKWLQTDYADPLEGWDIPTVIDTGKAYGAHQEDIYGCLYFFLSKQLRTLASRLRKFPSSFTILNLDARKIPGLIRESALSGFNVPSSMKFDRIEVSNILDANYVGLRDVLTLWGPLLEESRSAAITGYFMNWPMVQQAGRALWADDWVRKNLVQQVMEKEKMEKEKVKPMGVPPSLTDMQAMLHSGMDSMEAFYENSKPFFKFLQSQGIDELLRKTKLRLRKKHAIVPHRILAPLGGSPTALPEFPDDDTWYYYTKVACVTWSERYVEFERTLK